MTSSSHRNVFSVFIVLQFIHLSFSYPVLSESTSLDSDAQGDGFDVFTAHLLHRKKRAILSPPPTFPPDVAAHMAMVVPRSYSYVHKPALVYPIYYYPRYYLRIPRYYPSPKSELFRANDATNYINNLLPIFNKETPNVQEQIPAIPSAPVNGNGINSVTGGGINDALSANFPFWNQQASSWMWPDGIQTGALPKADVMRTPNKSQPKSTLFQLNLKDPRPIDFLHPSLAQDPSSPLSDILLPASTATRSSNTALDPSGTAPPAASQP